MANQSISLFNQITGIDIVKELNLTKFNDHDQEVLLKKVTDRLQKVILETALIKMSAPQFEELQSVFNATKDSTMIQEKVSAIAKNIPGLGAAIKENIAKEIELLKNIVNK